METALPTRETLLQQLQENEERFNRLIGRLSNEEQTRPFTPEGWSVKDFLAHMTYWKHVTNACLVAYTHDQPLPDCIEVGDEANEEQRKRDAGQSLEDTQGAWEKTHKHMVHLVVDELDDNHLAEKLRTPWCDADTGAKVRMPWNENKTEPICEIVNSMCKHDVELFDLIEKYFKEEKSSE